MDIKILLLKSLSLRKPLSGSHRVYCGKSFFIIKYVMNGKVLSIKSIKTRRKRKTWSQRIKYYNMAYKIHSRKKIHPKSDLTTTNQTSEDKETMTADIDIHKNDAQMEVSTQTIDVLTYTKEVQTETLQISAKTNGSYIKSDSTGDQTISFTSRAQQTIASVKYSRNMASINQKITLIKSSRSCQTDSNTESRGIQCQRSTQVKASNTEINTRDSFAQVQNDLFDGENSEEATKLLALPLKDFEIFIYMLNEIGDTVINQNQVLSKNSELLKQIMQINTLKNSKRISHSRRSISTQTDQLLRIETRNNYSQTKAAYKKPRKMLLFKGRKSQHNK